MARYSKRNSGKSFGRGYERAKQHIEDARKLTKELGGVDQDVKKWFFSQPPAKLNVIFKEYEKKYGKQKAEYALTAFPKWKSGRTEMSGTVAERLFKILPKLMPLDDKYQLIESLWKHVGPSKKRLVKCGGSTPIDKVVYAVEQEVMKLVTNWDMPEQLTNRFNWLSENDSNTYQKLLSYIKEQEKSLGEATLKYHIPELREKFNEMSDITSRLSYVIEINKQFVELRIEGGGDQLSVSDWSPVHKSRLIDKRAKDLNWIWWILGLIVLIYIYNL